MMARALKLDPVEFRRANILRDGRPQATGTAMKDAAIEAVLDRAGAAHEHEGAVRSRQRPGEARPRHRDRLQGLDLADHLDRHRQCRGRRQRHALLQHRRHGAGLRHRQCAARRRGAQHPGRVGQGRASRHRRDALRHGDARLALALSHGQCGAARGRGCQGEARGARAARSACRKAATCRSPSCSRRNTRCRPATSSAPAPTSRTTCRRMPTG